MKMSEEDLKQKFGVPAENSLVQTKATWKQRHGQDTDTYWYDELDPAGEVVNKYVLTDSTSMYPPFGREIDWEKQ
jgi:hypothetical protein